MLIDDDTVRTWHCLFQEDGMDGLAGFTYGGRASPLTLDQQATLKAWVGDPENVEAAQQAYFRRAKFNGAARTGSYAPDWEKEEALA